MPLKSLLFVLFMLGIYFPSICDVLINDISNLNATLVAQIECPRTIEELIAIVEQAKREHRKISVAGKQHSQGGQTFYKDAVVIDIKGLNAIIKLDILNKIITVQPGATWKQIQHFCNPYGLALKVTQSAGIFTVGGSLSVNCHGRDPNYGPLIETIESFRILLADGSIMNVSRQENQELFNLVIGGYGLFGIITEVDIRLTDNTVYKKSADILEVKDYAEFVQHNIVGNSTVGLHYGQLSYTTEDNLSKILAITYTKTDDYDAKAFSIEKERWVGMSKFILAGRRKSSVFKNICGFFDWPLVAAKESRPQITCRNNAMQHPVESLEHTSKKDTDLLQSYFIPLKALPSFIESFRTLIKEERINVLFVLIRYIPKDTQSFLRYARENYFEIVIFANVKRLSAQVIQAQCWTRKLIDIVLNVGGCYYLPTQLFATDEQLERAYPMIHHFFAKKLEYDPQELFVNTFYKRYVTESNER